MKTPKKSGVLKRNAGYIIIAVVIVAVGLYHAWMGHLKLKEYAEAEAVLRAEIEALERDVRRLEDMYAYAQTPEAIERLAREKLKMVKPNEIIYLIRDLEKTAP